MDTEKNEKHRPIYVISYSALREHPEIITRESSGATNLSKLDNAEIVFPFFVTNSLMQYNDDFAIRRLYPITNDVLVTLRKLFDLQCKVHYRDYLFASTSVWRDNQKLTFVKPNKKIMDFVENIASLRESDRLAIAITIALTCHRFELEFDDVQKNPEIIELASKNKDIILLLDGKSEAIMANFRYINSASLANF